MANSALPTPEEIKQLFEYEPSTGRVIYKPRPLSWFVPTEDPSLRERTHNVWNRKHPGTPAGIKDGGGYLTTALHGKRLALHRIAWAIVHGEWPEGDIDHINGDRADNRLANLRHVTRAENLRNRAKSSNNVSGIPGVTFYTKYQKWMAKFEYKGRTHFVGYFENKDDAASAIRQKRLEVGGFTERHISGG